jgi:hypothetical protein
MATSLPVPNYQALLSSFLLTDYLAQLGDRRFTAEERYERRMKLEYQLWKLEDLAPTAAYQVVPVISQAFEGELDTTLFPAIEWYLGFLSGKNEQWLRQVNTNQLVRFWRTLPVRRLRDCALQTLLSIEATIDPDHPERSAIPRLFADDVGLAEDGSFTIKGSEIAEVLVREALVAPPFRPNVPYLRHFSMRVFRFCLTPTGIPGPELVERALSLAGNMGEATRKEFTDELVT